MNKFHCYWTRPFTYRKGRKIIKALDKRDAKNIFYSKYPDLLLDYIEEYIGDND